MRDKSGLSDEQMYNTFNMGIGMVVCVAPEYADAAVASLEKSGEKTVRLGRTVAGKGVSLR